MFGADIWFWVWAVAAVTLFVGEIFTAGFFLLPFGLGAAIAAVLAFLGVGEGWQWAAFIVSSTVAFFSLRGVAERMTHEPPEKTGSDRLLGQIGVVIEDLTPNSLDGQVRVNREQWRADAPGHGSVPTGTRVVVEGISGTHLVVRPEADEVT